MTTRTSPFILGCALLIATQLHAQTLYRCGSVYQDRPCDAGKPSRAIGSARTEAAPAAGGVDAGCVQRGKDSLKIVWSREGGATLERLLAEAKTPAEQRLVRDVYRRPGAASTVQAAVEADCIAEKQKAEEETARAIAAAMKAQRDGTLPPPERISPPQGEAGAEAAAAERRRQERAAYEADRQKQQCAQYNSQLESLRARERAGGNARRMEELNDERRSLRAQMSSAGC